MDTSRDALLTLLQLQRVDSTIDRLQARLAHLPEQAALDALEVKAQELDAQIAERQAVFDDVSTRQRRLDFEVDTLVQKIKAESGRLYSGVVNNAKELQDISREVEALKRRKSVLEDNDLEVMEERDGVEKVLEALTTERSSLAAEIERGRVARDEAAGETGRQLTAAETERQRWVPRVDPQLLEVYDTIRASKGGVGAAAMVDGTCQGCHMRLPAQEAERVRTTGGLVRCDECQRILVVI
ncbi:MAG TPA: C4-type zinc ribbon domain-containing protein [Actinomycetota bacterium]|nr:C4-type zinc ribbon domain-containing protein [Actinomycetota bacterium]